MDTKIKIIKSASKLFVEKGFDGCSVDRIAREAEVNKASIYYHFKNKEELYETIFINNLNAVIDKLHENISPDQEPREMLYNYVKTFGGNFKSNKTMGPLMLREIAAGGANFSDEILALMGNIPRILEHILDKGVQEEIFTAYHPRIVHLMIVGTLNMFISINPMRERMEGGGELSVEEVVKQIYEIILKALTK